MLVRDKLRLQGGRKREFMHEYVEENDCGKVCLYVQTFLLGGWWECRQTGSSWWNQFSHHLKADTILVVSTPANNVNINGLK